MALLSITATINAIHASTKNTRSTNLEATGLLPKKGGVSIFGGLNSFYIGTEEAGAGEQSVSRIVVSRDTGAWKATAIGVAEASIQHPIKALTLIGNNNATESTQNTHGPFPVCVTNQQDGKIHLIIDKNFIHNSDYLKDASGAEIADGATITAQIPAIAASSYSPLVENIVFAIVPSAGMSWQDSNATTNQGSTWIYTKDGTGAFYTPIDDAVGLSVIADNAVSADYPIAFGSAQANNKIVSLGSAVDAYYDPVFDQGYIGLSEVTQAAKTNGLGGLSISINNGAPVPFVKNATNTFFINDNDQGIIGFVSNDVNYQANVYKIRIMHTSTGHDYVIINGGVAGTPDTIKKLKTKVFALPVIPQQFPRDQHYMDNYGQLAWTHKTTGIADFNKTPTDVDSMPHRTLPPFIVGVSQDYIGIDGSGPITDMQIIGDTVYVSVGVNQTSREQSHNADRGLFSSTAIFNKDGAIRAWTPWQRVTGAAYYNSLLSCDPVYGFGVDATSNNIWYLTSSNNDPNDKMSVSVTTWDEGDIKDDADKGRHTEKPLSAVLNNEFTNGVIINLFTFDGETPGFVAPVNNLDYFNMIVATGYNKVALIQTWKGSNSAAGLPTQKFEKGVNIFVHDVPSLGNITSAEVSRIAVETGTTPAHNGWLFVGGDGGLAVLCQATDGKGWDTTAGKGLEELQKGAFPGDIAVWKWKKLEGPNGEKLLNIRKIVADGYAGFIYVMTRDAVYRFTPNETDFASADSKLTNASFKTLINIAAAQVGGDRKATWPNYVIPVGKNDADNANYDTTKVGLLLYADYDELLDMMVVKSDRTNTKTSLILATSRGVLISNEFQDNFTAPAKANDNPFFKVVKKATNADDLKLGPVMRFDFFNSLRGDQMKKDGDNYTAEGNLYATAIDPEFKAVHVYRFDVSGGAALAIAEPYVDNGTQVDYFYQIGALGASASREFNGPADFMASKEDFGSSNIDFVSAIPITPDPVKFLPDENGTYKAISLGRTINSAHDLNGIMKIDPGSGAKYIVGEFGVLVNE
jgi:hypothetical protein